MRPGKHTRKGLLHPETRRVRSSVRTAVQAQDRMPTEDANSVIRLWYKAVKKLYEYHPTSPFRAHMLPVCLCLLLLLPALSGCGSGMTGQQETTPADTGTDTDSGPDETADPLEFENIRIAMNYCTAEDFVLEATRTEEGVHLASYTSYGYDEEEEIEMIREIDGDADLYQQIAAKAGACGMQDWDGFYESNSDVLDGESFSFRADLSDGTVLEAGGSNAFPDNFGTFRNFLDEQLEGETIGSTEFADGRFTMTVPETWVDQVYVSYGSGYLIFELPVGEEASYLFRMDLTDYGYETTDEDLTTRVGRLLSEDKTYFLSVYRYDYGILSDEQLTEEQQAIYAGLDTDLAAALESLEGAGSYEFVPEDGSVLYESDARNCFDDARSRYMTLRLSSEYSSDTPEEINGRQYLPYRILDPYHSYVVTGMEEVREDLLKSFSEDFTDPLLKELQDQKDLILYDGSVYVACNRIADESVYGSYYMESLEQTDAEHATLTICVNKALEGDEAYRYSGEEYRDFHLERNAEGNWVFTDFDYWDA